MSIDLNDEVSKEIKNLNEYIEQMKKDLKTGVLVEPNIINLSMQYVLLNMREIAIRVHETSPDPADSRVPCRYSLILAYYTMRLNVKNYLVPLYKQSLEPVSA